VALRSSDGPAEPTKSPVKTNQADRAAGRFLSAGLDGPHLQTLAGRGICDGDPLAACISGPEIPGSLPRWTGKTYRPFEDTAVIHEVLPGPSL
jgi:hypothetical protein